MNRVVGPAAGVQATQKEGLDTGQITTGRCVEVEVECVTERLRKVARDVLRAKSKFPIIVGVAVYDGAHDKLAAVGISLKAVNGDLQISREGHGEQIRVELVT